MASNHARTNIRPLTTLVGVVATILVGWVLTEAANILQPLVIAILLCSILQPVVRTMEKLRIPWWVTVMALLALLVTGLVQGGMILYDEVDSFLKDQDGFAGLRASLEERATKAKIPNTVIEAVKSIDLRAQIIEVAGSVNAFIRGVFLVVIYMLFIFGEQAIFRRKIVAVAETRFDNASELLSTMGQGIQRYLGIKMVTSLATGVLLYTLMQWLNLPYALLFGFITFLLNFIPTFGSIAAAVPPIAVALGTFDETLTPAISIAVGYMAVNICVGSMLEPRLLGRELNLSPLVVLLSVVVWAGMWGVPGMFLSVPLTATAQIVLSKLDSTRPIALLLSNGPPKTRVKVLREDGTMAEETVVDDETHQV
ncbi:MAG: AI-2 transport protein TqsA [Pseudohongiellaceae bacterium]|jgi:AI-2 transport protein TqsA